MSRSPLLLACIGVCASIALSAQQPPDSDRTLRRSEAATPARRIALVVGIDNYATATPLRNARNDARSMKQVLEELQFTVTVVEDPTLTELRRAVVRFGEGLRTDDLAFFFFAGHGLQHEQENYLLSRDYAAESVEDLRLGVALKASDVHAMVQRAGVGVVVLDACRTMALPGLRTTGTGLARMEPYGTLIAYAASAGQAASDNPSGGNGLFTRELVAALRVPGLALREVFVRARERVFAESQKRQFPAVYEALIGNPVLRPAASAKVDGGAVPRVDDLRRREELALWESIRDSATPTPLEDYLARVKRGELPGLYRAAAEARLAAVAKPTPPPPTPASVGRDPVAIDWVTIPGTQPQGQSWRATFQMGCVANDSECLDHEKPARDVTLTQPYRLMRTEVMVDQFAAFSQARQHRTTPEQQGHSLAYNGARGWSSQSGLTWRTPGFSQDGQHPVVHVSWEDAMAYCAWTGGRLPTEAEWEYAARAGRGGWKYAWGPEPLGAGSPKTANVADESVKRQYPDWRAAITSVSTFAAGYEDGFVRTAPVGSFPPNGFGLHDMIGNVNEFVADWYAADAYRVLPAADPRGPDKGDRRMTRGGSWSSGPTHTRLSLRSTVAPIFIGGDSTGFRCARDVP